MEREEKRLEAIKLREEGKSLNFIFKTLELPKSTAQGWIKDVAICETTLKEIRRNGSANNWKKNPYFSDKNFRSERARLRREKYQEAGRKKIDRNNWEHAAGCMLFWAEGSKNKSKLVMTNCDPHMLKFFVSFVKKYYGIENGSFFISVQYYELSCLKDIEAYWIEKLDIKGATIHAATCKGNLSQRKSKWPYGVCSVGVCNTELVNEIWGSVQEYVGFENSTALK